MIQGRKPSVTSPNPCSTSRAEANSWKLAVLLWATLLMPTRS
jgi:hypothetical protein